MPTTVPANILPILAIKSPLIFPVTAALITVEAVLVIKLATCAEDISKACATSAILDIPKIASPPPTKFEAMSTEAPPMAPPMAPFSAA